MYKVQLIFIFCSLFYFSCSNNTTTNDIASGVYVEGETISAEHQNMEFNFCYPACPSAPENCNDLSAETADTSFSFSQNPGKVFMLEMSASW